MTKQVISYRFGKQVRLLALAALFFAPFWSWGQQTDYSGVYYIAGPGYASSNTTTNYYLCPTEPTSSWNYYYLSPDQYTSTNTGSFFMTTYQCRNGVYKAEKAIWIVKKHPDQDYQDYYYIIRAIDGKYLTHNGRMTNNTSIGANRMRLHIETTSSPDDNSLFSIVPNGTHINIGAKNAPDANKYLNVNKGNKAFLVGNGNAEGSVALGGIIGVYSTTNDNSLWDKEETLCQAPDINFDASAGNYTITWHDSTTVAQLPEGYVIRYTEDGSDPVTDPSSTAQNYDGSTIVVLEDGTTVKAVVMGHGMQLSEVATRVVNTATPEAPTFEVTCDSKLQINSNISTVNIYYNYTIDGTDPADPDNSSTPYTEPVSLLDNAKVKAIAYNGSHSSSVSEVYTFVNNTLSPTVNLTETQAEITFETGVTIHYTTNGTDPNPEGAGQSTSPFIIRGLSYTADFELRVIATSPGHGNSCPVIVVKRPKQPTIVASNECIGTEKVHSLTFTGTQGGKTYWYALSNGQNQPAPALNTFTEYTPGSTVDIAAIDAWDGSIWVTLHAYAKTADGFESHVVSQNYMLKYTDAPTISYAGNTVTITPPATAPSATILYSLDGGSPLNYYGPFTVANGFSHVITATAQNGSEGVSCEVTKIVRLPVEISSLGEISDMNGAYDLTADVEVASEFTTFTGNFTGSLNGNNHTISNLSVPLFNVINGGTVNNLFFDNVNITTGNDNGNVGTVCCEATGASRIYNCGVLASNSTVTTDADGYTMITDCSSTISGSNYVGGLVGLLDGSSRVINCFSYANITGGNYVGGIVGYNNVATTATNLQTMVMNCMFYGEVSGTSIAPIYNGEIITNVGKNTGVSNFNYFRLESDYIQNTDITKVYHCALGAETRFLQRFEFYRHLLNSNRALAAWWATGFRGNKDEMLKWVLEPSQIGTSTPYPILKTPGKYPSVVNYDAEHALENQPRNKGGKLGTLSVTIQMGSGGVQFGPPTGAAITTSSLNLNITDKDTTHFNYNYYKVQLPYYNDVGTKNYNGNRVVTGWKIVSITGGTAGTYSTGEDVTYTDGVLTKTPYNFADRNCTNKDLYSVSGRVFNQGAYWDVPYGVTAITIEPYWAKCVYLSDAYADVVYNQGMGTAYNVPNVGGGQKYTNGNSYSIAGESQKVFTSKGDAIATSNYGLFQNETGSGNRTVYDYAVVLVGNYHYYGSLDADMSKPYTVTSIDLDGDNEPDYSYILRFDSRKAVHPVRVDFINIPGLGMAQKSTGGTGTYNFGIMQPKGWFESTNTSLFRETQFEYDNSARIAAPYIVQGGVMEQWVNGQSGGHANLTTYFHVGGNVWFKEFQRGTHQDQQYDANHSPVSVTGGDFDQFHLTGLYRSDATIRNDNAECYITGGRFGMVAGTGMDGLGTSDGKGNITWIIDNADIKEFYAGSFNADKPAKGNLHTIVNGGHIDLFCGGPKFGDMNPGRTVITTATGCTFGTFFGAGYGGNSYGRQAPFNHNNITNFPHNTTQAGDHASWNDWVDDFYTQEYNETYGGVSTQFNYQFIPMSGNTDNCARIFVEYVKFSLATTHWVTDTLTGCTITGNFYGGGSLGKVEGDVSSVLDSCIVKGNVYGAGQAATLPTVEVDDINGFLVEPYYYEDLGTYRRGVKRPTTTYHWESMAPGTTPPININTSTQTLYTTEDLNKRELGSVKGNVTLTIKGNSMVFGSVFGGGEESMVVKPENTDKGNTEVQILGKTKVLGNIYGGGNMGEVEGNTKVIVNGDSDSGSGGSGGGGN